MPNSSEIEHFDTYLDNAILPSWVFLVASQREDVPTKLLHKGRFFLLLSFPPLPELRALREQPPAFFLRWRAYSSSCRFVRHGAVLYFLFPPNDLATTIASLN